MVSKSMLYMTVSAQEVTGITADRKPVLSAAVELKNVWFDLQTAQNDGGNGKTPANSGTLIYDCKISRPVNFTFKKGMKIKYGENVYTVSSIKEATGRAGVEHYEIGVN